MQAHLWQHDLRTARLLEAIWALLGDRQWGQAPSGASSSRNKLPGGLVGRSPGTMGRKSKLQKRTFAGAGNACFLIAALGLGVCAFV